MLCSVRFVEKKKDALSSVCVREGARTRLSCTDRVVAGLARLTGPRAFVASVGTGAHTDIVSRGPSLIRWSGSSATTRG